MSRENLHTNNFSETGCPSVEMDKEKRYNKSTHRERIDLLDSAIITWITENLRHPLLNPVMIAITYLGEMGLFWIGIALILCITRRYRSSGILMLLSLAVGCIVGEGLLKHLFARVRPVDALNIPLLIKHPGGFSFPSGHSCSSFAAAVSLWYANRKWRFGAFALAFLIAFSRLYHGVHYLTDVLCGAALGVAVALLIHKYLKKYVEQFLARFPDNRPQ